MEVGNVTDAYTTEEELKEDYSEGGGRTHAAAATQQEVLEMHEKKREYPAEHTADVQKVSLPENDMKKRSSEPSSTDVTAENSRKTAVLQPEAAERIQNVVDKPLNLSETKANESAVSVAQPTTMMTVMDEANGEIHSTAGASKQFPSSQDALEEVYMKLDEIEDAIAIDERFPMEGVDDFEERYTKMFNDLDDALTTIDEHQMTMDVLELSHTQERIQTLKNDLTEIMKKAGDDRVEWEKLQQVLLETEKNVTIGDNAMDCFQRTRNDSTTTRTRGTSTSC
ncbi:hypothetical protein KIN20_000675 [Parelaphostrongylus tenuis]|uniref:Uncharacterized protein n=1 Tax=Parelaphostrongylus tenuis TaxID=148309 RepID=A0AAD5MBQ4_PARTN|nr:hypothetical protein KIN20_000675 [Parelaphostrongylus tenuis]